MLSYYIDLGFGKSFGFTWDYNLGPSECESSTLPLDKHYEIVIIFAKGLLIIIA